MNTQKHERGQALVEFAFLIPMFIFLFIVFVDLVWMTTSYIQLSNSVREGARYAMANPFNETEIEGVVEQFTPTLDHSQLTITASRDTTRVTVLASYAYRPITPGLQIFLGAPETVTLTVQSAGMIAPLYQ